jgi:hypothetical protein
MIEDKTIGQRLSDAGHGASRIVAIGRHPKPSTN